MSEHPSDSADQPASAGAVEPAGDSQPRDDAAAAESPGESELLSDAELAPAQRAEARRYGRQSLAADLADKALDLVYLGAMAFVFAVPLDRWLAAYVPRDTLRLMVLLWIVLAVHECLSLPLSWYRGHVLERKFGLSRQSGRAWLARHLKQLALSVVFSTAMVLLLYAIIWWIGPWWWLVAAAGFFVISVVLGQLAPVLILPLFYKVERLDDPALGERLARRAEGTGLSIEGVYRMELSSETVKANAMLAGLGRTRRVILGDTLLAQFSPEEIEVIFAHEIGHHVHRHIGQMMLLGLVFSLAAFGVSDMALRSYVAATTGQPLVHAELPVAALPLLLWTISVFSLLVEPAQNAFSRRCERQSDRYALESTGLREAYVSAFRKLARLNKDDPHPPALEVLLFHSHPPISERLAMADS